LHTLLKMQRLVLGELFARAKSKIEVVVTFIAVLELIRLKEIKIMQRYMFGDIELVRNRENVLPAAPQTAETEKEENNG